MGYEADETGQMREAGAKSGPYTLRVHELRLRDGLPRCGPKPDTWRGSRWSWWS